MDLATYSKLMEAENLGELDCTADEHEEDDDDDQNHEIKSDEGMTEPSIDDSLALDPDRRVLDLPLELWLMIMSYLWSSTDRKDIENLSGVNKTFHELTLSISWVAKSFDVAAYRAKLHRLILPLNVSPNAAKWIKRLRLKHSHGWAKMTTWDIDNIFRVCPNLEHLDLSLPIAQLRFKIVSPKLRSLRISGFYLPFESSTRVSATRDSLQKLLQAPQLEKVEFHACENLYAAMQGIDLQTNSLSIKSLTIDSCESGNKHGFHLLIRACRALEIVNIHSHSKRPVVRRDDIHGDTVKVLQEAFLSQKESLRAISFTRHDESGKFRLSYDIGSALPDIDFSGLTSLERLSLPLTEVASPEILRRLPPSLILLQVQVNAVNEDIRNTLGQRTWQVGKLSSLPTDVIRRKSHDFPNLKQLAFFQRGYSPYDSHEVTLTPQQASGLAAANVEIVQFSTKHEINETPFWGKLPVPR